MAPHFHPSRRPANAVNRNCSVMGTVPVGICKKSADGGQGCKQGGEDHIAGHIMMIHNEKLLFGLMRLKCSRRGLDCQPFVKTRLTIRHGRRIVSLEGCTMTKQIVLKLLREHTEEFLSGEAISRQAGVSRRRCGRLWSS